MVLQVAPMDTIGGGALHLGRFYARPPESKVPPAFACMGASDSHAWLMHEHE